MVTRHTSPLTKLRNATDPHPTWTHDDLTVHGPASYDELTVLRRDGQVFANRVFLVDGDLWVQSDPTVSHHGWWEKTIRPECEVDDYTTVMPPGQYIRITVSQGIVVNLPRAEEASARDVCQFAHVMEKLDVPRDERVQWTVSTTTAFDTSVGEYRDAIP